MRTKPLVDLKKPAQPNSRKAARRAAQGSRLRRRWDNGERGFVFVWMAICMAVLIGLTAFAIDIGNWYIQIQRAQRAADAAALAGDAALSRNDPVTLGKAQAAIRQALKDNHIDTATVNAVMANNSCVVVTNCYSINAVDDLQIDVRVKATAKNMFIQMIGGPASETFVETSHATHFPRLVLNSQSNVLGGPEPTGAFWGGGLPWGATSGANTNYWEFADGKSMQSTEGDRFNTEHCNATYGPTALDSAGNLQQLYPTNDCTQGSDTNNDYLSFHRQPGVPGARAVDQGYRYTLNIDPKATDGFVMVQAFDPALNKWSCKDPAHGVPADEQSRLMCPRDETTYGTNSGGGPQATFTYTLVEHDGYTPLIQMPFPSISAKPTWKNLFSINRTTYSKPQYDIIVTSSEGYGINHFMLRAAESVTGSFTNVDRVNSQKYIRLSSAENMPIFSEVLNGNTSLSETSTFDIAQISTAFAGTTVHMDIWDVGDSKPVDDYGNHAADGGYLHLTGDAAVATDLVSSNCTMFSLYVPSLDPPRAQCNLDGINKAEYNGQKIHIDWAIPRGYVCNPDPPASQKCGLRVVMAMPGAVNDNTVWSFSTSGTPLRLVHKATVPDE